MTWKAKEGHHELNPALYNVLRFSAKDRKQPLTYHQVTNGKHGEMCYEELKISHYLTWDLWKPNFITEIQTVYFILFRVSLQRHFHLSPESVHGTFLEAYLYWDSKLTLLLFAPPMSPEWEGCLPQREMQLFFDTRACYKFLQLNM